MWQLGGVGTNQLDTEDWDPLTQTIQLVLREIIIAIRLTFSAIMDSELFCLY